MANRQKFTRGALGHLIAHFERKKDKDGEYVKFGNQDIDTSRSYLNYNLAAADQPLDQLEFIHKRMKECSCLNRKDVNVMMTWCVTLPERMNERPVEEQRKFFELVYSFLVARYGKENVISAWVHCDESGQPHMHFAYTPVMYDKAKDKYKFNAKAVGSKSDLQSFHPKLDKYLTKEMGYETGVITGETEINMTMKQLKELSKRLSAFESELKKAVDGVQEPKKTLGIYKSSDVLQLVEDAKTLQTAVITLQEENRLLKAQNERLEASRNVRRYLSLKTAYKALDGRLKAFNDVVHSFLDKFKLLDVFNEFKNIHFLGQKTDLESRYKAAKLMHDFDVKNNLIKTEPKLGKNLDKKHDKTR